ncbi:MAG: glutamate-5-semialdehyde dehydrogenase [Clostridia bacterium]|nr:glutamate-5-semialdehyde dehydrogenase [Clostridia bacterium]
MTTREILLAAKAASLKLALLTTEQKNAALLAMADALERESDAILAANCKDIEAAEGKITPVMIDRLRLTHARISAMAQGIREVVALPDPIGEVLSSTERADGLIIKKVRVPLGVVGIIYESRPNVTSDAAALSLKSGNVCVLRGGKEAYTTSHEIVRALKEGLVGAGFDANFVNMLDDVTREGAKELMTAVGLVDVLIPRGGAGLIRSCVENATVPCIQTGTGICHIYVDRAADQEKALRIIENAKTSRPSVCNAAEVCLVHREIAREFLPRLRECLQDARVQNGTTPVELRLDPEAASIIDGNDASDTDFDTEFLDYILAIKVVADVGDAVAHIAQHSTHHSEAIITEDTAASAYFCAAVDSAAVYVNASTRFTDGGEFGLGCEIGISTQKLHARGPMGLEELTAYKYIVLGSGQIRK